MADSTRLVGGDMMFGGGGGVGGRRERVEVEKQSLSRVLPAMTGNLGFEVKTKLLWTAAERPRCD